MGSQSPKCPNSHSFWFRNSGRAHKYTWNGAPEDADAETALAPEEMDAPRSNKANGTGTPGFLSLHHSHFCSKWAQLLSFTLACDGYNNLLTLRIWFNVWLLTSVILWSYIRAKNHMKIHKKTVVNGTTLITSPSSQTVHAPNCLTSRWSSIASVSHAKVVISRP